MNREWKLISGLALLSTLLLGMQLGAWMRPNHAFAEPAGIAAGGYSVGTVAPLPGGQEFIYVFDGSNRTLAIYKCTDIKEATEGDIALAAVRKVEWDLQIWDTSTQDGEGIRPRKVREDLEKINKTDTQPSSKLPEVEPGE